MSLLSDHRSKGTDIHSGKLDFRDRRRTFAAAESATYDLIVIGAGITGAGIARDAALRGLSVALVDARDIAAGTSSRSSKMIHGGLRYLAQGDVGLVREAATERQTLRSIAPHLTRMSPFVFPGSKRTLAKLRAGLWAFERLGRVPRNELHEIWDADRLAAEEPMVAAGNAGAAVYPEFLTNDARLTLANVRSAAAAGATVLTYAPVTEILTSRGRADGVRCTGALPGESLGAELRAPVIVNAAGPWVDAVRALEADSAPPRLQLTKGIHLVVPHERLPLRRTILMTAADKRPVFAVPSGEITYLGTTDTFHPGDAAWPEIDPTDVHYLLDVAARTFAGSPLCADDIVAMWSGVRPLVAQDGKSPSEISRSDEVWDGPAGVLSIAGGKLTAYRRMAERICDTVVERLGAGRIRTRSDIEPLCGGDLDPGVVRAKLAAICERPATDPAITNLVNLYGSEAIDIADDGADLAAEVRHAVCADGALTLEDVWVRRTARAWFRTDPVGPDLDAAAQTMGDLLGWSAADVTAQTAAVRSRHADSVACLADC